jgi:hypothetical protein
VRGETASNERASRDYEATGVQILELAQSAYSLYVTQNPQDQAKSVKTQKMEIGSPYWMISATG